MISSEVYNFGKKKKKKKKTMVDLKDVLQHPQILYMQERLLIMNGLSYE